jgi:uncharacterized membrane protein YfcA
VGAAAQGSIGFGQNLITVPVIALLLPEALPGTMVVVGVPLSLLMAAREHHGIDRRGVAWIAIGRVPGTIAGVLVVATVSTRLLGGLAGVATIVGVLMSALAGPVRVGPQTASAAGLASGVMGTAAAIDGPPLALLYQHHPGHAFRPTLAVCFLLATVMSFVALVIGGLITADQLCLALALVPGSLAGFAISRGTTRALHGRDLRPIILAIVAITGASAVVRAIVG